MDKQNVTSPPVPPPAVWLKVYGSTEGGYAKLVIDCRRCGKIAPNRKFRRTRCPKCKSPVDDDLVIRRVLIYELVDGRRRRLSSEEMERRFDAFCREFGQ